MYTLICVVLRAVKVYHYVAMWLTFSACIKYKSTQNSKIRGLYFHMYFTIHCHQIPQSYEIEDAQSNCANKFPDFESLSKRGMLNCIRKYKKPDLIPADHQKLSEQALRRHISRYHHLCILQLIALAK